MSDYHFFWHGILSQWARTHFTYNGVVYNCCEQAMMAAKAMLFNDQVALAEITSTDSPRTHKAWGRKVKGFDPNIWNANKRRIVHEINYARAESDWPFREALLATGDLILVEASPYDRIWGIGYSAHNALRFRHLWGQNLLGLALTDVRNRIQSEEQ